MIAKVGKIVCKVLSVCCIVAFCLCIVAIIGLSLGVPVIRLGSFTLESILSDNAGLSKGAMLASCCSGALFCAAEGILTSFAARYLDRELADGTPFTTDGAKTLMQLGILTICLPIGARVIAEIMWAAIPALAAEAGAAQMEMPDSVVAGLLLIVLSLVFRYGAELTSGKNDADTPPQA